MSDQYNKRNELTEEEIRIENEILSMKIQAEYGGECHFLNDELPPEVQHDFLKTVYEFQQQLESNEEPLSLFQQLGEPVFQPVEQLSEDELDEELQRLHDLLFMNQFVVDSVFHYPAKEMYRFITEELFNEQVSTFSMPGFFQHYCYEDYHPNPLEEVRRTVTMLFTELFSKRLSSSYAQFESRLMNLSGQVIEPEQLDQALNEFYQRFDSARMKQLVYGINKIESDKAYMECTVVYDFMLNGISQEAEQRAAFEMHKEMDILWIFERMDIPGLKL